MRYIACFEPSKTLTDKLSKDGLITYTPSSSWHCTLWSGFDVREEDENWLLEALSRLEARSFITETLDFSIFYQNSYVLTLSKPSELQELHEKIVRAVRPFDKDKELFDEMVGRFGLDKYNPHITLSKTPEIPELHEGYRGISMQIDSYSLIKNKSGLWQKVSDYRLEK